MLRVNVFSGSNGHINVHWFRNSSINVFVAYFLGLKSKCSRRPGLVESVSLCGVNDGSQPTKQSVRRVDHDPRESEPALKYI